MKRFSGFAMLLALFLVVGTGSSAEAAKGKVKLAYVEWSCATASIHVVQSVIEDRLGYDVEVIPVGAAAMWQAVAAGDVDGMTTAWLPLTHGHYMDKVRDKVEDLGVNCKGAGIGLVVPAYVTIGSIEEMNANAKKFGNEIVGIDPGAGIMSTTEKALDAYGLDGFELMESSGAMMTAILKEKIKKNEWVVVTGWTPHWKFARWDLKYLKDPKGVYGGEEEIHTVVRKGLKEDMPDVYRFLDNFEWSLQEIGKVMAYTANGADPADSAKRWIKENPQRVEEWLKK